MPLSNSQLGRETVNGKSTAHADLLIYGRSGAGKTYFAATAPKPLYVITHDPTGHKSIPFKVQGRVVKTIQEVKEDLLELYKGGHGFKTIIVDGLSFLHDLYVKEVGQLFVDQFGAKDPDLMPMAGRMKIIKQFKQMLRAFIDLSQVERETDRTHVIMTTLEERLKESDEAPFHIRPLFGTEKMNTNYPALFSSICYIVPVGEMKDNKVDQTRRMLFAEYAGILARDRLGIFPSVGQSLNLSDFLS